MKVRMCMTGDTDNSSFIAMRDLILAEGWPITITPITDPSATTRALPQTIQPTPAAAKRKRFFLGGGKNLKILVRDFLLARRGAASITSICMEIERIGYARNSAESTISWLKKEGYAAVHDGVVILSDKPLTNEACVDHRFINAKSEA